MFVRNIKCIACRRVRGDIQKAESGAPIAKYTLGGMDQGALAAVAFSGPIQETGLVSSGELIKSTTRSCTPVRGFNLPILAKMERKKGNRVSPDIRPQWWLPHGPACFMLHGGTSSADPVVSSPTVHSSSRSSFRSWFRAKGLSTRNAYGG